MSCGGVDDLINEGEGEGILGASLVVVFEIDAQAPGFVLHWYHHQVCQPVRMFDFSNESGLNEFGQLLPHGLSLGFGKRRNLCLTGLNPFNILRLCLASLRGIPGISEGCQANMSQFSRRNARSAASTVGFSCAPIDAVFLGSVGSTLNLTISSAGLKEVDLGRLSRITSSLSTIERSVVNSSAVRASDSASRARDAVLFSARSAMSGSLTRVIIPFGPGILSFIYP